MGSLYEYYIINMLEIQSFIMILQTLYLLQHIQFHGLFQLLSR
jgi:hypothetical protein